MNFFKRKFIQTRARLGIEIGKTEIQNAKTPAERDRWERFYDRNKEEYLDAKYPPHRRE